MGIIYAAQSRQLSAKLVEYDLINADEYLVKIGCSSNFWYRAKTINGLCKIHPSWQYLKRNDWRFVRFRGHAWWSRLSLEEDESSIWDKLENYKMKQPLLRELKTALGVEKVPRELFVGDSQFISTLSALLKRPAGDAFKNYYHQNFVQNEFETSKK